MRHPGACVAAALVTAASGIVANVPADSASAATAMCSVRVRERVVVNAPTERIRASLDADCDRADVAYASWNIVHPPVGVRGVYIFDGGHRTDVWAFHDWDYKGRLRVGPSVAYDSEYTDVPQNGVVVEVRYAARVSLAARRLGGVVTLRARATRYSSAGSHFGPMRGRRTFFAARSCQSCAWHRISAVTTGRFGRATLRVRAPRTRDYRAVMRGTTSVWGRTSRVVRT